jgi:ABC-type multidrug transport system fused ATPase/permease subunit
VLDEATSAVDAATDALIQESIRSEFRGCTILVIAHRLLTVADFDQVLVMSEGKVVEAGPPKELWQAGGVFRGMVDKSGDRDAVRDVILGSGEA